MWLIATACAGRPPHAAAVAAGTGPAPLAPCENAQLFDTRADSVTVVVTANIDPLRAAHPGNAGERFIVERAYETLVRVDCHGHAAPGLAASWKRSNGQWVFTLRDTARYWSGRRVTASDVIGNWRAMGGDAAALADSATAAPDGTLQIRARAESLTAFARRSLDVRRPAEGGPWPEGTGAYRITGVPPRVELIPVAGTSRPRVIVRGLSLTAARDAIDADVDIVLSDDPATIAYAAARSDRTVMPLEWDRTWALVVPHTGSIDGAMQVIDTVAARALRASLARDAVRRDARGAVHELADARSAVCDSPAPARADARSVSRIVYRANDPVARGLAERLVAIASDRRDGNRSLIAALAPALTATARITSAALNDAAFDAALRTGAESALIVSLPLVSATACVKIFPLIDVRWSAVVRRVASAAQRQ